MPESSVQSYANHRRYLLPWHLFVMPVIGANVVVSVVACSGAGARDPGTSWCPAVCVGFLAARWMSRQVQDRVVRLEETLRLERLLPGRRDDIERLTLRQLIGFASPRMPKSPTWWTGSSPGSWSARGM